MISFHLPLSILTLIPILNPVNSSISSPLPGPRPLPRPPEHTLPRNLNLNQAFLFSFALLLLSFLLILLLLTLTLFLSLFLTGLGGLGDNLPNPLFTRVTPTPASTSSAVHNDEFLVFDFAFVELGYLVLSSQ